MLVGLLFFSAAASAQTPRTALYGEVYGTTGSYAVGAEQVLHRAGPSSVSLRLGVSYLNDELLDSGTRYTIFSVPAGVVLNVPLGTVVGVPLSVETEAGAVFATWNGTGGRFNASPGERFRLFPQASGYVRAGVAGPVFLRAGMTLSGVRRAGEHSPSFGLGVGL